MRRVANHRVTLGPPGEADLAWILGALKRPEVWRPLGWEAGPGAEVYAGYIDGRVLLRPFWNAAGERVGFVLLMRQADNPRVWSVSVAVPDPRRRNGFTTLAALDALCHLLFDVRGEEGVVWLIEPGNGASRVLPRRLGYPKVEEVTLGGTRYERYGIGPDAWRRRRERLARAGRPPRYAVEDVPLPEVAHGRIIAAVRAGLARRPEARRAGP